MKERKEEIRAAESEHIEKQEWKTFIRSEAITMSCTWKSFPKVPLNSMYLFYLSKKYKYVDMFLRTFSPPKNILWC